MARSVYEVFEEPLRLAAERNIIVEITVDSDLKDVPLENLRILDDVCKGFLETAFLHAGEGRLSVGISGRYLRNSFELFFGIRSYGNINFVDNRHHYGDIELLAREMDGQLKIMANRIYLLLPLAIINENKSPGGQQQVSVASVGGTFDELPEIAEFDWNSARNFLEDNDLIWETLTDFYHSIDKEIAAYENWLEGIDNPETLAQFRIRVHALKSTSKMLGANMLSGLARKCELMAINSDVEGVRVMIPVVVQELKDHKERIRPFMAAEEKVEKLPFDADLLKGFMRGTVSVSEEMDIDALDVIKSKVTEMEVPARIQGKIEDLASAIEDIEFERAGALAEEILKLI